MCELELVSMTSPECSPVASKLPNTLALELLATVKVSPSIITPTSFCAVGLSFAPKIVIVMVAVVVSVPSLKVYTKTSVTLSPSATPSAASAVAA